MTIEIDDFASSVIVRQLTPEDYPAVVALQQACFPNMAPWTREEFISQVETFPEGQLCVEYNGQLVASAASLIVDESDYADWHDWRRISDNGRITNHDPEGDTLYGIEIQVHPEFRGMKLARRLYDARKELCRRHNLMRMVIGGRIPGYGQHRHTLSAREYVERVIHKDLYDPVLTSQLANGFALKGLIPDYLPSDEDSAGYATYMEWVNLGYIPPRSRRARRAVWPVRVSSVQYPMRRLASWDEFARQVEQFIDTASDYRADFVLFPELFTLQLLSLLEDERPGTAARQLAGFTPRYLELLAELALHYNINIIGGSQFTLRDNQLYNIAYLFHRDGRLDEQYKLHITPSERRWWGVRGGDKLNVFQTDRGPVAILICYDVEFPELVRVARARGARMIFVPYNTNDRMGHLRVRTCTHARCVENNLYAVTAGCVGHLSGVENADLHYATSAVLTPLDVPFARDGLAAEASPEIETVLVYDLDLELLRRAEREGTVTPWRDRRPDLYRVVSIDSEETSEI